MRLVVILAVVLAGCGGSGATPESLKSQQPPEAVTPEPIGRSGEVTFGTGLDDELQVEQEKDTFTIGELGAFSGNFSEPAGATTLNVIISSQDAAGAEGVVYTEEFSIANPEFDVFGIEEIEISALVNDTPGDYVLRFFRDATRLAEGTFTITE